MFTYGVIYIPTSNITQMGRGLGQGTGVTMIVTFMKIKVKWNDGRGGERRELEQQGGGFNNWPQFVILVPLSPNVFCLRFLECV